MKINKHDLARDRLIASFATDCRRASNVGSDNPKGSSDPNRNISRREAKLHSDCGE
jgi:hypothetical protein